MEAIAEAIETSLHAVRDAVFEQFYGQLVALNRRSLTRVLQVVVDEAMGRLRLAALGE
jgi:hypothetical protein